MLGVDLFVMGGDEWMIVVRARWCPIWLKSKVYETVVCTVFLTPSD